MVGIGIGFFLFWKMPLRKMPQILADRTKKWTHYSAAHRGVGDLQFMSILPGSSIVPFRFPILTGKRDALAKHLEASGVQTRGFFYPMAHAHGA